MIHTDLGWGEETGWVILREKKFSKVCRHGHHLLKILHYGNLIKNRPQGNSKGQGMAAFKPWRERKGHPARLWLLVVYNACIYFLKRY